MKKILALVALLAAATAASAHTGHGTHSLMEGLAHPLGADHLLAMLAVGVWSAAASGRARWAGPGVFLGGLLAGALLGAAGLALPLTERAIALSVAVFGAMLLAGDRLPRQAGLALIAAAATLHGLAHGAELPAGGLFATYAAGFIATTAVLHAAGLGLGEVLRRLHAAAWRLAGASLGLAGLLLLARA
ncbi:HupE/UreJ family protein [Ideonella sp. 4Y16]|uniref:HupE/UreJ family protein n=1 Tax=Ideonella alba TaxID=2824118 RepID=UPI001B3651BE|nr:HupE/UreJ family protein [Ideonella alba]MBQ0944140.1 HupE/UreJ family protein [Ideonella alba]